MRQTVLAAALVMAACSSAQDPTRTPDAVMAEVGEELVLAVGGAARLADGFTLALIAVSEDSRCPSDVQCPWEGTATLVLRVTMDGASQELRLDTHQRREAAAGGYVVTLLNVAPTPRSTRAIEPDEYRVTLRVDVPDPAS
ncbi:MAG TPA: hypothetical protein VMK65_02635 [Longimicrobiales bacterium]|nr:hypothetical protein [Longimicrobiales bacterium]